MSAPEGNKFWELRATHGRDLIFSSPEILWEAAKEYFEATSKRVWIRKDWVGKDAIQVERESVPPFTLKTLFMFLDISEKTWRNYRLRQDYVLIITRIEDIIFSQKFEGAAIGAYNSSIIARDLGLVDKVEKQKTKIVVKRVNGS